MSTELGGYPNDTASKGAGRKGVTVTSDSVDEKTYLDVKLV